MHYEAELHAALQAVRRASRVCSEVQQRLATADAAAKKDRSPVTVADFAAQAVILSDLEQAFPDDPVVGEEDAAMLRDPEQAVLAAKVLEAVQGECPGMDLESACTAIDRGLYAGGAEGRFWTLDPIDGTKGFLRGEQYAVALALIENGEVVLGVLGCPNLPCPGMDGAPGSLLYAIRGSGAFQSRLGEEAAHPIAVESDPAVENLRLAESVEAAHTSHSESALIAERLGIRGEAVRIDSQCKYAVCARGDASLYLRLPKGDYVEKIWDHAAGAIVATEAGGRVSDVNGKALDFSRGRTLSANRGVVVSNGPAHDQVIEAVQAVLG